MIPAVIDERMRPRAVRWVTGALRAVGRRMPVPGWFPLVVERVHPLLAPPDGPVRRRMDGFVIDLDLRDYVQRRIYYDSHEPGEVRLLQRVLRPGDEVLDVGANVGYFTCLCASLVGREGRVHAFEPVPGNYDALRHNVELNGFDQVTANRVAVADAPGTMVLGTPEKQAGTQRTSGCYMEGGPGEQVTAEVIRLDDYVRDAVGERAIRLVKIDVEGVEERALAGLRGALAHRPPDTVLLEVNKPLLALRGSSMTIADLLAPLVAAGYRLLSPTPRGGLRPFRAGRLPRTGPINVLAAQPTALRAT